jgi:hypothetical protein
VKITKLDDQLVMKTGKVKNITITNHGCTYRISSDFFGLKIKREDSNEDVISILPRSNKEIVVK